MSTGLGSGSFLFALGAMTPDGFGPIASHFGDASASPSIITQNFGNVFLYLEIEWLSFMCLKLVLLIVYFGFECCQ